MYRLLDMLHNLKVIPIGGAPSEEGVSLGNIDCVLLSLLNTLGNTRGKLVGFGIILNFSLLLETQ